MSSPMSRTRYTFFTIFIHYYSKIDTALMSHMTAFRQRSHGFENLPTSTNVFSFKSILLVQYSIYKLCIRSNIQIRGVPLCYGSGLDTEGHESLSQCNYVSCTELPLECPSTISHRYV